MIVVAAGALYLVDLNDPTQYVAGPSNTTSIGLAPNREVLVVADFDSVSTFDTSRARRWTRTLAVDGIELREVTNERIVGRLCMDPPRIWHDFSIRLADGADA